MEFGFATQFCDGGLTDFGLATWLCESGNYKVLSTSRKLLWISGRLVGILEKIHTRGGAPFGISLASIATCGEVPRLLNVPP